MRKIAPEKMDQKSVVSRLIGECSAAFRTRVTDDSGWDSLLCALDEEHKKLIHRFNRQSPNWNSPDCCDSLKQAAARMIRVCVVAVRTRISVLRASGPNRRQSSTPLLNGLCELCGNGGYSLLKTESLQNDPVDSTERDAKILSFERATHQIQVEACCCFLLDLKDQSPITAECLQDWAAEILLTRHIGDSFRKEREHAAHMLAQLSNLTDNQFCDNYPTSDRALVSAILVGGAEVKAKCGDWNWFTPEAGRFGRELLREAGYEVVSKIATFAMQESSDTPSVGHEVWDLQNLRGLHNLLRRKIAECADAVVRRPLTFASNANLAKLRSDLQRMTPRDVAFSSFDQLRSRCNDSVESLRLVLNAAGSLKTNAPGDNVECPRTEAHSMVRNVEGLDLIEESRQARELSAPIARRSQRFAELSDSPLPNERIRAAWGKRFDALSDNVDVVFALSLAVHPWPDMELPNDLLGEIAAELLPATNLTNHDLFQVCADRLWRIAEIFDAQHCVELEQKYSAAARHLADVANLSPMPLSARVWSQPSGIFLASPTGLGGFLDDTFATDKNFCSETPPTERLSETLTHIAGVAATNRSSDLGMIGGGEPTNVTVDQLADRLGVTLPIKAFDTYLSSLESRQRGVLIRRKLTMQTRRTLDEVGEEWGITRERIRQIEYRAFEAVDRLFKTRFMTLGKPVFRQAMKCVLPTDELHEMADSVCRSSRWADSAAAFMLHSLGPWTGQSGWSIHHSLENRLASLPSRLAEAADAFGVICDSAITEVCGGLFRNDTERDTYLKACVGLGCVCGRWTIKNTNRCRIVAALVHLGQPATKEEVAALANVTPDQAGSSLTAIEGIVRADRYRWGFSDWIDDEYDGIAGEIIQRIDAYGGVVRAELLLTEIPELFNVSEGSVRAYLASDAFVVHDGLVRRADADEFSPTDVRTVKDAILIDGNWGHKLRLYQRHFDGYSLGISFDIAYANGVRPDDALKVPIVKSPYEASVIWRLQTLNKTVDVGRVAEFLRSSDFQPDDEVVVIATPQFVDIRPASDLSVHVNRKDLTNEASSSPINDPLLDMLGGDS